MENNKIIAAYARVSSEKQAQQGTIGSQITALKERICVDEHTLSEYMLFLDEGVSATTLIRPALERLRDTAASGVLEKLYVLAPDRLSRKYAHQMLLMEELAARGVEVIFLNHAIGSSPEKTMLLQMQGMIAEYERAKIMERNRRGKLHAARLGNHYRCDTMLICNLASCALWTSFSLQHCGNFHCRVWRSSPEAIYQF